MFSGGDGENEVKEGETHLLEEGKGNDEEPTKKIKVRRFGVSKDSLGGGIKREFSNELMLIKMKTNKERGEFREEVTE